MIWRNLSRRSESTTVFWTRFGLWISAGLALTLALLAKSVVGLWHDLGSIGAPALVVPMLSTFSNKWRLRSGWALTGMIAAGGISLIWLACGWISGDSPWLGIEPILPGLAVSLACYYAGKKRIQ
jgi:Na+/proline symporter